MKKFIKIIFIITVCFLLAACNRENNNNGNGAEGSADPHPSMIDPGAPLQLVEDPRDQPPDEPIPIEWPPSGFYFTLTDEERMVYERLITELSTDVYEGLSPISVAKVFIQAGIDGEWEAEFYSFSTEGLERTKEEWQMQHELDIQWFTIDSRRGLANWAFPFIDYAVVIDRGNMATLVFHSVPEPEGTPEFHFVDTLHVFTLVRNDRGIWEMRFQPHVLDDELAEIIDEMIDELMQAWDELADRKGLRELWED